MYIEKQKIEKEKTKKPKKGGGKPKLRMEANVRNLWNVAFVFENNLNVSAFQAIDEGFGRYNGNDYDAMDDFM